MFSTYHGYGDPEITLKTELINEDKEDGYIDYSEDDFWDHFDNDTYMKDLSENVINTVEDIINDLFCYYLKIETPAMYLYGYHSPREYNFSTDDYHFTFKSNYLGYLIRLCLNSENRENFQKFLGDNFTSRDGFISFVPNNIEDFTKEYLDGAPTAVGTVLRFLIFEYYDTDDIVTLFFDNLEMYYSDYYKPSNK